MTIQDLRQKARTKEREVALCSHVWEPQGKSAIDRRCISSMRCTVCGERRAPTEEEAARFGWENVKNQAP